MKLILSGKEGRMKEEMRDAGRVKRREEEEEEVLGGSMEGR